MSYPVELMSEYPSFATSAAREWFSVQGDLDDFIFYDPGALPGAPAEQSHK